MKRTMCILLAACILVVGCGEPVKVQTASGKPEVTIPGRVGAQARNWLMNRMLDRGHSLVDDSPTRLVFEQKLTSMSAAIMYGSKYDSQPNLRATYTIIESTQRTRVLADLKIVTNPGSAFERVSAVTTGADINACQNQLFEMRATLSKMR